LTLRGEDEFCLPPAIFLCYIKTRMNLAPYLDHANHSASSTADQIKKLCSEVKEYNFNAAFVNPCWVGLAREALGEERKVGTVISFPLGQDLTRIKIAIALDALRHGADELDISTNVGWLKQADYQSYEQEMEDIVQAVKGEEPKAVVKFIIEAVFLTESEIKKAANLVLQSGADFVKTTSGLGDRDAKIEFVKTIREVVGDQIMIKAAGGIHTRDQVEKYLAAGANRIGTSAAVEIVQGIEPKVGQGE
jgi:deoxyribose-phosphate aldolase